MCDTKGPWSVQDKTYQLMEFAQGGLRLGGQVLPVVPIVCENCGNTVLVNALVAGLIENKKNKMNEGDKG